MCSRSNEEIEQIKEAYQNGKNTHSASVSTAGQCTLHNSNKMSYVKQDVSILSRSPIYELCHAKKVLRVILIKMFYFSIFWMCVILKLFCEILSRIAVKIRSLSGRRHYVYAAASYAAIDASWYLRNDMQNSTLLFCIWTSYVTHSDYLVPILTFYNVPVPLYDVKNFFKKTALLSKHVSIFLLQKYDIIFQLRHSYAKYPFCETRLIWSLPLTLRPLFLISILPCVLVNENWKWSSIEYVSSFCIVCRPPKSWHFRQIDKYILSMWTYPPQLLRINTLTERSTVHALMSSSGYICNYSKAWFQSFQHGFSWCTCFQGAVGV